jgi:hypothetical protein
LILHLLLTTCLFTYYLLLLTYYFTKMDATPPTTPETVLSGNLDSDFFCELNGITTQFPHKSSDLSSDSGGELVPFDRDESSVGQDGIENQRTEIPPHKQGHNKALLILGLVSLPMAVIVFLMFSGGSEPAKIVQAAAETPPLKPKVEFAPDPRFAVAQSKLAMQQQEQQLLAASRAQQESEAAKALLPPTAATNLAPVAATIPTKVKFSDPVAAPEQIVASSAPTNVQPPILPSPTPTPIKIEPTPRVKSVETGTKSVLKPVESTPRVKPVETVTKPVQTAIKPVVKPVLVASRGSTVFPTPPRVSPSPTIPAIKSSPTPTPTVTPQLSWREATAGAVEVFGARRDQIVATVPQLSPAQTPSLNRVGRVIIAGQNRVASLITPLQILAGEQGQELLLNLEQGFVNTQGSMSIPANTKIIAQITVAGNGMLRIGDAKVTIGGVEHSISTGNLMLTGTNNQPLVAELKQFNGGEIGRRDLQTFLIGAAQGLGKVLTQPSTQTQITTGGAAISTSNNNPNIVGGILEGGAAPIAQQWAQRNQTEVKRLEGEARVWFLPAGSKISLYTTKPFEIK